GAAGTGYLEGIDPDFFDVVQFGNQHPVACHHDFGVGIERSASSGGERPPLDRGDSFGTAVDREGFRTCGALELIGVNTRTAVHEVTATGAAHLRDGVAAIACVDDVPASTTIDGVCAS